MEEYVWNPNFENLDLFPHHIYNNFGLIYHGTSTIYSDDIENNGFRINHLPFPIEGLREIINLLADLGEPSDYMPNDFQFNFNHAGAIEHYLASSHDISFTISGYPALKFASGSSKGGQIVGKIKNALNRIRALINLLLNENPIELIRRLERIEHIDNECNDISNAQGVIYVIRPSMEIMEQLYTDHKVVFSREAIPVESIIAKLTVDANFVLPENFKNQSENIINTHFSKPQTIGFHFYKKQMGYDDTEDN
ncbi:hypothetical protein OIU80_12135 [Flavobacterium sp. LS1R47]|uniref:Uncharacterized protein n=1 Tax=Flavobacterium frigoritolerans TaxID=2987686 RepID=A0A9X2ZQW3_9FLAO|nr:hypothetical protein [Flavobacterium frigoritolerans]MCV9933032.1 hypothetical protein [Flavobacterium frigoritolerans]